MIKRPLNEQFSNSAIEGRKTTTIRDQPWPVGVPIMLYNWSGPAYRSKHRDVTVIEVVATTAIQISHYKSGKVSYFYRLPYSGHELRKTEGFDSQEEMDEWFRHVVPVGKPMVKALMIFRVLNAEERRDECQTKS